MSVRRMLAAAFAVSFAALCVVVGMLYWLSKSTDEAELLTRLAHRDVTLHMALTSDVRWYLIEAMRDMPSSEARAARLAEIKAQVEGDLTALIGHEKQVSTLETEGTEAGELERTARLASIFEQMTREVDAALVYPEQGDDLASRKRRLATVARFEDEIVAIVQAAISDELEDLTEIQRASHERIAVARGISLGSASVAIVVAGALLFLFLRSVRRGVGSLLEGSMRVATGDLGTRVPERGPIELRELAARFNDMVERLDEAQRARSRAEKLAAVGQLAASIGHDLRNPLGAVQNALHYVRRRTEADGGGDAQDNGVARMLSIADRELQACARIVGDLLDFARERPLMRSECPLRQLVADAISVVQAPETVRIDNEVPDSLPLVYVDRDQLRQVLVNLVQNGVEAVPSEREGHVRVTAGSSEAGVWLSVIDDGAGIAEVDERRIFEPLFSTKRKGTGLGLAIVSGIVERHGGSMNVETKQDEGTRFTVTLPRPGNEEDRAGGER